MAPNAEAPEAPEAEQTLAQLGGRERVSGLALVVFGVVAVGSLLAGPLLIESIWLRMAALDLLLLLVALAWLRLDWVTLWRPTLASSLGGLGAGLFMWAGAFAVAALLTRVAPTLWAGADELYAWADDLALAPALALLILIVAGEEIIWRGALGLGVAAKLGVWPAVLISAGAFTLAHASIGSPVLLIAAALAGAAWTYLAIRTRSLWAPFVAHLLWDVGLLWLTPLV